ncbi:LysR family transcriptional regulator [Pseudoalteromonas sp. McH1-7]|uniref:LysR family transcriptional regulator n=1 Tax=Pseudoalteromonas TaxID=53246 RepID=UPI00158FAF77|nr:MULTISPECIES: LysR family transcriptional regulator [Pseudoalteromonas]MDW7550741.1 LysR family transcriptional regulator [Pseudoalteromonas peptidolytica]NUZ12730.1 LysR family transcriptional regulator [Pseudoalteromonas sp. McH1-7]USD29853.1 LysR family transcriptional regulator [Pseudoalteromonas sp. SCSIO 43201]
MKDVFSAIPIFVAVVEAGSFSLAAERLGMTKSAVSKRISSLEDNLGTRLFHRSTRKLVLTESGEEFSDYARNSVYIAQQGITAATLNQGKPKGTLKINAPMTFSRLHLAPHLKEFLDLYPDIKVILSMDDQVVDMIAGAYDVGIRIGELKDSSLIARKLAKCNSVVCASPEYLQQAGIPNTPHDLKDHNCIYYSLFQAGVEWTFFKADKKLKVEPTGNFIVNNSDAICEMLLQGLGICQMPTFIVQRYLNTGQLVPVLANYDLPDHSIFAVYPERRHIPEKVKVFIDFLEEKLHSVYWEVDSGKSS